MSNAGRMFILVHGTGQVCTLTLKPNWMWLLRAVNSADTLKSQQPQVLQSLEFGTRFRAEFRLNNRLPLQIVN